MDHAPQIVAATDLSELSLQAVERAFLIAKAISESSLTVVHALGLEDLSLIQRFLSKGVDEMSKTLSTNTRRELTDILVSLGEKYGLNASIQLENGQATNAIPTFVNDKHADLLVIGAHGKGFLERILLGSTASNLLSKSKAPVLTVKKPASGPYKNVLVAVDFSHQNKKMIQVVRRMLPDVHFNFLHVYDLPFEGKLRIAGVHDQEIHQYRDKVAKESLVLLHDMAVEAGLKKWEYSGFVVNGDPTLEIVSHEQKLNIDLIVMGKRGLHITEEFLLGSVTKRVLAESVSDVLVVMPEHQ